MKKKPKRIAKIFDRLSTDVTRATGHPLSFIIAVSIILIWGISGPVFNFSDTWQLVINTGTTIITFLMVFIIQQSQNKEMLSLQLKLDELIAASGSSNRLIDIEDLTEQELLRLKKFYVHLARKYETQIDKKESHSIEEDIEEGIEEDIQKFSERKKRK